jgi:superfamily II DNA or RNA helicase
VQDRRRDPHRNFSDADRRRVHDNQDRRCFVPPIGCGERVRFDAEFHVHHVNPHNLGGATVIGNAIGLCSRCHRRVDHAALSAPATPTLRGWQTDAVPRAVEKLSHARRFTAAAAPGAGKTMFAGFVTTELLTAGLVERVVVFVPTENLTRQWADELALHFSIFIDSAVVSEPDRQRFGMDGCAVTYATLSKEHAVRAHIDLANEQRTLFIFDEVHHCADKGAWGKSVQRIVEKAPRSLFMNLSGTMFRSKSNELIATAEYEPWDNGTLKVVADVEIHAMRLIQDHVLRGLDLYEFDSEVRWVDLTSGEIQDGSLGIAGEDARLRSQALTALHANQVWLTEFFTKWLAHLEAQRVALGGYPLKGLVVARDQAHAQLYTDMLTDLVVSTRATPVWVAKSEDGQAARIALEDARKSKRPGVLVSVAMASEGYDNPDLSSIAYLSNVSAPLRLAQIAGRVMRPTRLEAPPLAGTVWLPAMPELTNVWRDVLVNSLHVVELDAELCGRCGHNPCVCSDVGGGPRICSVCGLPKPCGCPPMPVEKADVALSDPMLAGLTVNGEAIPADAFGPLHALLIEQGRNAAIPHIPAMLAALYQAADGDAAQVLRWIEGTRR